MAENGYNRNDGTFVEKVYSDAEPHKFAEQIKKSLNTLMQKIVLIMDQVEVI